MFEKFVYGDLTHQNASEEVADSHTPKNANTNLNQTEQDITPKFKEQIYQPGDIIFKEGDPGDGLYLLHSGEVTIFKMDSEKPGAEEVVLANLKNWGVFGEMSLFDKQVRSASVRAVTTCKMSFFPAGLLEWQLKQQPFWVLPVISILANRLRATNNKLHKVMDAYKMIYQALERNLHENSTNDDEMESSISKRMEQVHRDKIERITPEDERIQKALDTEARRLCNNFQDK